LGSTPYLEKNLVNSYKEYLDLQEKIKLGFPIKHQLTQWIDKIRGKRILKDI
jgi:hypothetical protein